jgi:hypothetical protein
VDAVIYTRVSRDVAGGRPVEDQERECRQACERKSWPVRAAHCGNSIGASRYSAKRPAWQQLNDDLREGDILVVWEPSRAVRRSVDGRRSLFNGGAVVGGDRRPVGTPLLVASRPRVDEQLSPSNLVGPASLRQAIRT